MGNLLLDIVSFLVVLGPLVIIHELGHFIAARTIGVTVLEFGLGLPPRAAKLFESQGTEFTLNWLPLGGFVRPLGEDFVKPVGDETTDSERAAFDRHQAELEALGKKRVKAKSLMEASPLQRIWFMIAGSSFNFVGAFLILVFAGLLGEPRAIQVIANAPNSPAAASNLQVYDLILAVNGQEVVSTEDLATYLKEQSSNRQSLVFKVQRGAQMLEVTVPPTKPTDKPLIQQGIWVTDIAVSSPAEKAGLKPDDIIVSYDDTRASSTVSLQEYTTQQAGKPIVLQVMRGAETLSITVTPRSNPPAGEGRMGIGIADIRFNPAYGFSVIDAAKGPTRTYSLGDSISLAYQNTVATFKQLVSVPIDIITQRLKPEEGRMVSPVGIAQISSQVVRRSVEASAPSYFLSFVAMISMALGVTNLLPIPGLDGGRILFVLIEILRGKPLPPEREGMVHLIGLGLLLALVAILVVNDLVNPIVLPK